MTRPSHSPWCDHLNNTWWGNVNAFPSPFMCICSNICQCFRVLDIYHQSLMIQPEDNAQGAMTAHKPADQQPLRNVCKHAKLCYVWQLNSNVIASMRSKCVGWLQHKGRSGHGLLLTYLNKTPGMSQLNKVTILVTVFASVSVGRVNSFTNNGNCVGFHRFFWSISVEKKTN